jgi:phosphotransferase system  glucose/maltose/N-acetylglucosamine-specific IIC component
MEKEFFTDFYDVILFMIGVIIFIIIAIKFYFEIKKWNKKKSKRIRSKNHHNNYKRSSKSEHL